GVALALPGPAALHRGAGGPRDGARVAALPRRDRRLVPRRDAPPLSGAVHARGQRPHPVDAPAPLPRRRLVQRFDAIVVGGGPAGSSVAYALGAAGASVCVVDRAAFPRDKTCAGWITPPVLEALGVAPAEYAGGRTLP